MENFGPWKDFEKVKWNPITGVYTYELRKKPSPVPLNKTFDYKEESKDSSKNKIDEAFSKSGSICPCDKCS